MPISKEKRAANKAKVRAAKKIKKEVAEKASKKLEAKKKGISVSVKIGKKKMHVGFGRRHKEKSETNKTSKAAESTKPAKGLVSKPENIKDPDMPVKKNKEEDMGSKLKALFPEATENGKFGYSNLNAPGLYTNEQKEELIKFFGSDDQLPPIGVTL